MEEFRFSFAAHSKQRVPGAWIKDKTLTGKLPIVIVLHGAVVTRKVNCRCCGDWRAAEFLAVAIDGRYHGERTKAGSGSAEYNDAMLRTLRTGDEAPFLYDTVWDLIRLIDWLETRPEADTKRVGAIGFSKGGVQSFRWALENDSWQSRAGTFQFALNEAARDEGVAPVDAAFLRRFYDHAVPGIYSDFNGPQMVPLIAPRPLLVINEDSDARTPRPGLIKCIEATRTAYARAGANDKFEFLLQTNTRHKVNPEALDRTIDWRVRWLGPRR